MRVYDRRLFDLTAGQRRGSRSPRQESRNMPLKHRELRVLPLFKRDVALCSNLLGATGRSAALRERDQSQASLHMDR
jgi:hypothetical protein